MNPLKKAVNIVYKIDASDKTTYLLTLFQVLAVVLYWTHQKPSNEILRNIMFYSSVTLQALVALLLVLRCIVAGRIGTIKLRYNKATGTLYDRKMLVNNVSLRSITVGLILNGLVNKRDIFDVGKNVGESFYRDFEENLRQTGEGDISVLDKIDKWLDYDSSSGMGKFERLNFFQQPPHLVLQISCPFTGECSQGLCLFLRGYVLGFCEHLFNQRDLVIECPRVQDSKGCAVTISVANRVVPL